MELKAPASGALERSPSALRLGCGPRSTEAVASFLPQPLLENPSRPCASSIPSHRPLCAPHLALEQCHLPLTRCPVQHHLRPCSPVAAFPGDTNSRPKLGQSPVPVLATPPALAFTICSSCLPLLTFLPLGLLCPPLMLGLHQPGPTRPASRSATRHLPRSFPTPSDHGPFLLLLFPTL